MKIGIDFGGVLTPTTTPPNENYLETAPNQNSAEVIIRWKALGHIPILISKASNEEKEEKARSWMSKWHFDELFDANKIFCREQVGKISACSELQVEIMIDDSPEQLEMLESIVPHRLLFNTISAPIGMIAVRDWLETEKVVTSL